MRRRLIFSSFLNPYAAVQATRQIRRFFRRIEPTKYHILFLIRRKGGQAGPPAHEYGARFPLVTLNKNTE